jgi:hypothetical protein
VRELFWTADRPVEKVEKGEKAEKADRVENVDAEPQK